MSDSRRYGEQEIAEILRRATEAEEVASPPAAGTGLTLAQIQEVGGEVGIAAARIERAARSLDLPEASPPARFLGAPRSVTRMVPFDRPLSDDEWMRLVVILRETFGARGTVEEIGPLRTWYNGNLHVHVEPWEGGHRVRMSTFKGNVTELTTMGAMFLLMGVFTALIIYLKKGMDPGLVMSAMFGALGLGVIGRSRLALPLWADTRAAQMEGIAERIPRLLDEQDANSTRGATGNPG
ncbi:MAG: hypothetical protein M8861_13270 [marine benthic group bacterium]|nr:hypothetical protein [Gemmatimonadota bacterium]